MRGRLCSCVRERRIGRPKMPLSLMSRNRAEEIGTIGRCRTEFLDGFSSLNGAMEPRSKKGSVAGCQRRRGSPQGLRAVATWIRHSWPPSSQDGMILRRINAIVRLRPVPSRPEHITYRTRLQRLPRIPIMSTHGSSPSAPVFTNLDIRATHPPQVREQTRKYLPGRRTPNLATVPSQSSVTDPRRRFGLVRAAKAAWLGCRHGSRTPSSRRPAHGRRQGSTASRSTARSGRQPRRRRTETAGHRRPR